MVADQKAFSIIGMEKPYMSIIIVICVSVSLCNYL